MYDSSSRGPISMQRRHLSTAKAGQDRVAIGVAGEIAENAKETAARVRGVTRRNTGVGAG
jgi:hypothetical protein